ncbi:MAG: hypothetical protein U1E73_08570 [Planctomycetota bacterium]
MTAGPASVVDRRARVLHFAAALRWRHAVHGGLRAALVSALVLALPALLVTALVPAWLWTAALAVAAVAALQGLVAGLRAARVADAALLAALDGTAPAAFAGFRDELATWLELEHRQAAEAPMPHWLGDVVDGHLRALDRTMLATVGRRRLGRARWLVPIVLLALLVWLLSYFLFPNWPGLLGGRPDEPGGGAPMAGTGGPGEGAGGGGSAPQPKGAGESPVRRPPREPQPQQPPPPEQPAPPEPTPPAESPPLLSLPPQQVFAVPEFVDDGPTRRMRAHVAEVPEGGGDQRPESTTPNRGGELPPPPVPPAVEFARAAERAQNARHVPPAERPIVRRFFELLHEAAK